MSINTVRAWENAVGYTLCPVLDNGASLSFPVLDLSPMPCVGTKCRISTFFNCLSHFLELDTMLDVCKLEPGYPRGERSALEQPRM